MDAVDDLPDGGRVGKPGGDERRAVVLEVVVDGRVLMRDGRLLTVDEPALLAEAEALLAEARDFAAHFVDQLRTEWCARMDDRFSDDVMLVVSELITNADRHSNGPYILELEGTRTSVTVAVYDSSDALPALPVCDHYAGVEPRMLRLAPLSLGGKPARTAGKIAAVLAVCLPVLVAGMATPSTADSGRYLLEVTANTSAERTQIAKIGVDVLGAVPRIPGDGAGPLRIGVVCHPTYGGSGAVAAELGLAMAARGHTVHFFSHSLPFRVPESHPGIVFHEVQVIAYPLFKYPPYALALATKLTEPLERSVFTGIRMLMFSTTVQPMMRPEPRSTTGLMIFVKTMRPHVLERNVTRSLSVMGRMPSP